MRTSGWLITVRGLVQGVGLRPAVWQIATRLGLAGRVRNTASGVEIELACEQAEADVFIQSLKAAVPPLARIDRLDVHPQQFDDLFQAFSIAESLPGRADAAVTADAKICKACAAEIREPSNRRYGYAFANCTHCGPRLTIVRRIPYDRANTAMSTFPMCADCRAEYENPADRRFHAEPIACAACGPRLWLECAPGVDAPSPEPLGAAAELLKQGRIVALKGLGGFHLACLACDEQTVARLRRAKARPQKPLAVMAADLNAVRALATCSRHEAALMDSAASPILLMGMLAGADIAPSVAPGQSQLGLMLPTTALHLLLLDAVGKPLVMTSANESGIPQCITNEEARLLLGETADAVLLHDRDIVSRVDDSVVRLDGLAPTIIRRARGYAPQPLALGLSLESGASAFAAGADLKAAFAFARGGEAVLSQHLGDLGEPAAREAWQSAFALYAELFDRHPDVVAVDTHPDYASSAFGRQLADQTGARLIEVQHHHAHLASCMAENGAGNSPVLGVILDGAGHGPDGTVWGGEFLLGDYRGFERLAHFRPVPLVGGDRAALEPWRCAFAHLADAFGPDFCEGLWRQSAAIQALARRDSPALRTVLASTRLSPRASSAGRLFDAAAFLIGIAPERMGYEGQTGMELEALAADRMTSATAYRLDCGGDVLDWSGLWRGLLNDIGDGIDQALLAARFHATLIDNVAATAVSLCRRTGVAAVALSGGVFQNRLMLEGVSARLADAGLAVLRHTQTPANDGGLCLGQAAVALASCR